MGMTAGGPWVRLVLVALVTTACGGGAGPSDDEATPSAAIERPTTDAVLEIVQPAQGETVGRDVVVEISLEGATVSDLTSQDLRPDEGHLHVLLDDELISMTSDLESEIANVEPGTHLLKVEFVANDHAPFDPRVIVAVQFEVAP